MRQSINTLLFSVLLIVSVSSCSVASKSTMTGARSVDISPRVEQVPTLVELTVDSTLVKIDSCWTDSLFHQTFSIQKEINNLIGRVLEENGGDVFILPNSVWERQGTGFLKTEHYLSVTGYIGRYKGFRTATLEDIKTINEYKYGPQNQQPEAPLTAIYLGRNDLYGGGFAGGPADGATQAPVKKITKPANKKPFKRKKGFAWGIEYSMGFLNEKDGRYKDGSRNKEGSLKEVGDNSWESCNSYANINLTFGAMLNEYLYLGGGAGFKSIMANARSMDGTWVGRRNIGTYSRPVWIEAHYENVGIKEYKYKNHGAPVFIDTRLYFSDSLFALSLGLKLGFHFANDTGFYLQSNAGFAIGSFYVGANLDLVTPFSKGGIPQVQAGPIIAFLF